jgi:hypothetical protein
MVSSNNPGFGVKKIIVEKYFFQMWLSHVPDIGLGFSNKNPNFGSALAVLYPVSNIIFSSPALIKNFGCRTVEAHSC